MLPAASLYLFCICAWQCYCLDYYYLFIFSFKHMSEELGFLLIGFQQHSVSVSYYPGERDVEDH